MEKTRHSEIRVTGRFVSGDNRIYKPIFKYIAILLIFISVWALLGYLCFVIIFDESFEFSDQAFSVLD